MEENPSESYHRLIEKLSPVLRLSPLEQIRVRNRVLAQKVTENVYKYDAQFEQIISTIKPDAIIMDNYAIPPSIIKSGIPWVWVLSCNPLIAPYEGEENNLKVPPSMSGYSTLDHDLIMWKLFRDTMKETISDVANQFNAWISTHGLKPLKYPWRFPFVDESPYLNLYLYPAELDYTELRTLSDKWHRVDAMIRVDDTEFRIPDQFLGEKIIFFSLGSIGCADLELMRHLIDILAHTKHRVIVSKGPRGDEIELAGNMWGENMLPQTQILPHADLVITHGGNNTFTESLYFGKAMIVLPMFGDQHDNAQRIAELGLGARFNGYTVTREELLGAIERLINDEKLTERLAGISRRIQTSKSREEAADKLEEIVRAKKGH